MHKDDERGFGKPPEHSQFKPGQSGNPNGRPKGSKNTYTLLNEILNQKININVNGKDLRISKKMAMLTQLVNKGVKGDIKAIEALLPHILMVDAKEEDKNKILSALYKDDQKIISTYLNNLSDFNGIGELNNE